MKSQNNSNYLCKYCEKQFDTKQALVGHETLCKLNPKYDENISKIKLSLAVKYPKNSYEIICPRCGKIHIEKMTQYAFKKGKYKKYCSSMCAHSRNGNHSEDIKRNISFGMNNVAIIKDTCNICGILFDKKITAHNTHLCKKCLNKKKYEKSRFQLLDNGQLKCKICGSFKNENACLSICNRKKLIQNFLIKYFNFDKNALGNKENILLQLEKIKNDLCKDYIINQHSLSYIQRKYNFKGYGNIIILFNLLKIPIRNLTDAAFISTKYKKLNTLTNSKYKSSWHITWNNKRVFLRSSYELDFAKKLDQQKINYDVEKIRISYWDSQLHKNRIAIPDFYLIESNQLIEIKSSWTYDEINMIDKFKQYKKLGYFPKLILDHVEKNLNI